ncbi:MAG: hypothetical protein CM1200mP9_08250 [Gammaproteobacteria bacterium]|nr:MAG: hypothetical protein CM1200mP9_08250 [Gammaproteobacteria bacterium]
MDGGTEAGNLLWGPGGNNPNAGWSAFATSGNSDVGEGSTTTTSQKTTFTRLSNELSLCLRNYAIREGLGLFLKLLN